jgi:Phosphoadenosine phosphosulfate reductase family
VLKLYRKLSHYVYSLHFAENVVQISAMYGLTVTRYAQSYKDGMADLVQQRSIKAVLMGQRYGDPWTDDMDDFTPSTKGWPEFMRVNPVLRWPYSHVWKFLRGCALPYCSLYDEGYTSLGEAKETIKNSALLRADGTYKSAHELHDETLERSNRSPTSSEGKALAFPELPAAAAAAAAAAVLARSGSSSLEASALAAAQAESVDAVKNCEAAATTASTTTATASSSTSSSASSAAVVDASAESSSKQQLTDNWRHNVRRALPVALASMAVIGVVHARFYRASAGRP